MCVTVIWYGRWRSVALRRWVSAKSYKRPLTHFHSYFPCCRVVDDYCYPYVRSNSPRPGKCLLPRSHYLLQAAKRCPFPGSPIRVYRAAPPYTITPTVSITRPTSTVCVRKFYSPSWRKMKFLKTKNFKEYFTVTCIFWAQKSMPNHRLWQSLPLKNKFQNTSNGKGGEIFWLTLYTHFQTKLCSPFSLHP